MENSEMYAPVVLSTSGYRRRSRINARSMAKDIRYSGNDRIPRIACAHNVSASCSAVTLTQSDLFYIKGQMYLTHKKIEQDAFILLHLDIMQCKRRRARIEDEERRRQRDLTIKYTVFKEDKTKVPVCQATFLSIFCVGKDRVIRIARYWLEKGRARPENRGGYRKPEANTAMKTLPETSHGGSSKPGYLAGKQGTIRKNASATMSSVDSLSQPTAAKIQKKTGNQLLKHFFEKRKQKSMSHSAQSSLSGRTQVQRLLMAASPPAPAEPASRQIQVQKAMTQSAQPSLSGRTNVQLLMAAQPSPRQVQVLPVQVQQSVPKPKPVEKPRPREKRIFVVSDHQRCVMSNLATLWKNGKLCDASIGNGSSAVMVHKLVLTAVCPKLLSVSNMDIMSHEFLQVNFPGTVGTEALNAFAEYMYNGVLDLDPEILEQLKIIAKRLDMKEFQQLCDNHLQNHMNQSAALFTNIPLNQTTMPDPAMTSFASFGSTNSMQSAPSVNTQVIDVKQEITDAELVQIHMDTASVFGQESEVASLAPNKSGNTAVSVISPSVKTEPVGPEDNKYGHYISSNQPFTSTSSSSSTIPPTASSSIASVPKSSIEFDISFLDSTDVKSTRLKAPLSNNKIPLVSDLSPVSGIVGTVHSQTSSIDEVFSKPLSQSSVNPPNTDEPVYPVRLFSARGDNLPLLTKRSSDAMTVNSLKPSEKT